MARIALALTLAFALLAAPAAAATERPNVVVVMTDDQDFRSMGAMPKVKRLLADRGTTFDQAIVSYPLCCPSRATFYTGQYPHNHGVKWNNFPEGGYYRYNGRQSIPVWLKKAGYETIHIGKYLNEYGERNPREIPPGWTDWHGGVDPTTYRYYGYRINHNGKLKDYGDKPADYSVDVTAELAEQAVERAAKDDRPFFLNVAPIAPHTDSMTARAEGTPAIPAPRHANSRFATAPLPRLPNFNEPDISDKPPGFATLFPGLTEDEIASQTEHYQGRMGSLLAVDDLVAKVHAALRRTGELENTVIVYTSDNGWILAEHRMRDPVSENGRATGVKYAAFEGSSRVPLIVSGPGVPKNRNVGGVVSNADLAPTILEAAKVDPPRPMDGRSLLPVTRRPSLLDRRAVLIETFENPRGVPWYSAARTDRWRYELYNDGAESLYDLVADPYELENRAADPRYAAPRAALAAATSKLAGCRGRACAVSLDVPDPLP